MSLSTNNPFASDSTSWSGIQIGARTLGAENPIFIVAELSANHGQDFEKAVTLVRTAQACGADAVKLQTYTPDTMTIDCRNEYFRIGPGTIWEGKNLHELYREAYTPWEWQPKLKEIAEEVGLPLFSTPFDSLAVEFLERMNVPAYKIASFEIVDLPLLRCVAATGKPVILSTGMATWEEIREAVQTLREAGTRELALLKCTSAYPARPEEMNLRGIPALAEAFGLPVGLSDHTLGIAAPVAAVTLGACILEKHLTLSRNLAGPDSAFSLEPEEFRQMVMAIRETEKALGKMHFGVGEREASSRIFRRSLFVVEDMKAGEAFTEQNIRSIRPGYGLHTRYREQILGCRASCDLAQGTPLSWSVMAKAKACSG
jgi:pseudaminic acid synthase